MSDEQWSQLISAALADERLCIQQLRAVLVDFDDADQLAASRQAAHWIEALRVQPGFLGAEQLLREYPLGSAEGMALMALAEALLRIPEPVVANQLIRDLLGPVDWDEGSGDTLFASASRRALALSKRWLVASGDTTEQANSRLRRWATRLGEPLLRRGLQKAMRYLAGQFVFADDIEQALRRARTDWVRGITHTFDMLGEAALTAADAERYQHAYCTALESVGNCRPPAAVLPPSVSIKLSALHPRFEPSQQLRLRQELLPRLQALAQLAAATGTEITFDAEEADRLELSLAMFEQLYDDTPAARGRVGLAVQAYAQRALPTLHWLGGLATRHRCRMPLRLVKGAYWDSEIKRAQQRGLDGYPVFTHKRHTDIAYLACGRWLLQHRTLFRPQFATHNAVTIASLLRMQPDADSSEFQRLHGMGQGLYEQVRREHPALPLRIYAPVGSQRELLPYLVRRLLENGASASFVRQLHDDKVAVTALAGHPLRSAASDQPPLPLPSALFAPRRNSAGIWLHSETARTPFLQAVDALRDNRYEFGETAGAVAIQSPYDGAPVGRWQPADTARIDRAVKQARQAQPGWQRAGIEQRAACLERAADQLQAHRAELVALMGRECGKTLEAGLDEVREAVDFCRYYASQARRLLPPRGLPGPAGEENQLLLEGRGLFVCISPWNFPLAIFLGQITAALVTGNAVLAKPAEQATLTAELATRLLHGAGVPADVLQLLPGSGEQVGSALCGHDDIDGVVFTGGLDTARLIQRRLAQRSGAIASFIAETAGINVLIADSSALPQQLIVDVLRSAFDSAGQRCSALRVLYLPRATAAPVEALLQGAMQELRLGDPLTWGTDIGPVIDADAQQQLLAHIALCRDRGSLLCQAPVPSAGPAAALLVPPTAIRIQRLAELQREVFGPILHIIHYAEGDIDPLVDEINAAGYGLTAGIHSRNDTWARQLAARLRVGNCYINRDMIGAVVESQPFGGRGLSGTGPKAGGPHYLLRFISEKTVTVNTAALGGDAGLLSP